MGSKALTSIVHIFIFLLLYFNSSCQTISKLREFKVKGATGLTVDRLGNFFVTFKNGTIRKYDPDGNQLTVLKSKLGEPTLIEPWFHPSIFVYYQKSQEWIVYDREFKNPQAHHLDPSVAIEPSLVCPTNDNKLLVFDKADHSVKKIDRFRSEQFFEFKIDTSKLSVSPNFTFMREYQNLIFLLDKRQGIFIYNSIGKLVHTIAVHDIESFGVYGEEIFYYTSTGKVSLVDLYATKSREIPLKNTFLKLCITDERLIGIGKSNLLEIFRFVDELSN